MPRAYQYFTCSSHILTDGRTGAEKTSIESMHLIPRRSRARWACDYDWRQSGFGVSIRATKEHTHRPSTCRSRQWWCARNVAMAYIIIRFLAKHAVLAACTSTRRAQQHTVTLPHSLLHAEVRAKRLWCRAKRLWTIAKWAARATVFNTHDFIDVRHEGVIAVRRRLVLISYSVLVSIFTGKRIIKYVHINNSPQKHDSHKTHFDLVLVWDNRRFIPN